MTRATIYQYFSQDLFMARTSPNTAAKHVHHHQFTPFPQILIPM